jgi:HAMP domain-containing protein
MSNRFAAKVTVQIALLVAGLILVSSVFLFSVIKTNMINDAIRHEADLADTIIKATRYAMLKADRITLGNIISNVGEQKYVEHVRIFNKKGLIMFSSRHDEINRLVDKKDAGCIACHNGAAPATQMGRMEQARRYINEQGKHVLAITAPIYNEPDCSSASCHFHPPGQKLVGTLDIGFSEESLLQALSSVSRMLTVFCVIVLVLSVGGVTALLRHNVITPVKELTDYIKCAELGTPGKELRYKDEVGEAAQAVRRVADRLNDAQTALEAAKRKQAESDKLPNGETRQPDGSSGG